MTVKRERDVATPAPPGFLEKERAFLSSGELDHDAVWFEEEDDGELGEAETSPARISGMVVCMQES